MPNPTTILESDFLASCRYDPTIIDTAVQRGLTEAHFADPAHREQWRLSITMRLAGEEVSDAGLYAKAVKLGVLEKLGGVERIITGQHASSLGAGAFLEAILAEYAKRESWRRLHRAIEGIEGGTIDLGEVRQLAEEVAGIAAGQRAVQRTIDDIDNEIGADVKAAQEGTADQSPVISWGVPKLDKYLRPIRSHEYVLICARPSRGKSSMLTHIAGHNLMKGKRVAFFTLETSDKAVVQQMAGQLAEVRLECMRDWMPQHYSAFNNARAAIRGSKRLLVYDKDMTLDAITSRCRMLATSFKPDVVILDYLGLVATNGKSPYERVSMASKAMIPLRKVLGCPLICGQQLNRGSEKEEREPNTADLRDSGQLEEDAARIVMLHWKDSRYLDQEIRGYKILQPKLRDGRTTAVDGIDFHSPTTTWRESSGL